MATLCSPTSGKKKLSCLSLESLQKISRAWNNTPKGKKRKIKFKHKNHQELLKIVRDTFNKYCKDDSDIVHLDFIKKLPPNEFFAIRNEFRPVHPKNWINDKWAWLSTLDINAVLSQYEKAYPHFKYTGASPIDFDKELMPGMCVNNDLCKINLKKLYSKKDIRKIGMVFNLDPHDKRGTHWVSMVADLDTGGIYFFDSYALPPNKEIFTLMKRIRKQGNDLIKDGTISYDNLSNDHTKNFEIISEPNTNKIIIQSGGQLKKLPAYLISEEEETIPCNIKTIQSLQDGTEIVEYNSTNYSNMIGGKKSKSKKISQKSFQCFYNNVRFQKKEAECGTYSIYFVSEFLKNKKFKDIIHSNITDDFINDLRYNTYFREPKNTIVTQD